MALLPQLFPLTSAKRAAQIAELEHKAAAHKARTAVLNRYQVLEPNTKRQQPRSETGGEGKQYDQRKRAKGANLGRTLESEYPPAKSAIHQTRVNVVGSLGKLRVNVEGGDDAAAWFNSVWAPCCDYRCDTHWSDWLQNTIAGIVREGDQLTVFDDGVTPDDTGQLLTWEADQVAPLADDLLKHTAWAGAEQDNGILRDARGREIAYVASGKHGQLKITKAEDFSIYPRGLARLMCNPWRHNQGRGVPGIISSAATYQDMHETTASEIQTAKRAAKDYAFVTRKDAVTDWDNPGDDPEFLPENTGKATATTDAEGANVATYNGEQNLERLEAMTGGLIDYGLDGETIQFADPRHPNPNMVAFLDAMHGQAGAGMGLAKAYAKLCADKSYTAFRGDMIMTWVTFEWMQKRLERIACDWVARHALNWAMRRGIIDPLPAGWDTALSWSWPKMPEVDGLKAQQAILLALQTGTMDFARVLGPDWKNKLIALGEQKNFAEEQGLALSAFDSKAGPIVVQEPERDGGDDDSEGDDDETETGDGLARWLT